MQVGLAGGQTCRRLKAQAQKKSHSGAGEEETLRRR
jgi:hypothetical protein